MGIVAIAAITVLVTACNPGFVTSLAGNGTAGNSGDGGPATAASLNQPGGLVVFPDGSYDVVDQKACVIRHVSTSGTISTIAGTGTCGFSGDGGPATTAQIKPAFTGFEAPSGQLAVDAAGNLYLADSGNGRIRRIATDGTITTIAGNGTTNILTGCSGSAVLPGSLAFALDGTLYVDCPNGVFELMPGGSLHMVIGDVALSMTLDQAGNLYYADLNGVVHKRTPDGSVTTYANVPSLLSLQPAAGELGITGLSIGPDGSVYAALGPVALPVQILDQQFFNTFNYNEVLRLGPGMATVIAGGGDCAPLSETCGDPDPGTGTQSGYGRQLAITPYGIAATAHNALLISSGHNVYSLQDANTAQPWSGTACDPALVKPGYDLSNRDLSGINFYGCNLSGVNFSNANLSGANLKRAVLGDANLSGTDLSGANLTEASLTDESLLNTNLSGADLTQANLAGATLTGTNLSGGTLTHASLAGATLTGTNLSGATLTQANLAGAVLSDVDLSGANLTQVVVDDANLSGVDLSGATLDGAHGVGIIGTPAALPAGWYVTAGLLVPPDRDLSGLNLSGRDLTGADLAGANLTNADLADANLTGADLSGANASNVNFSGANFTNANLSNLIVSVGTYIAGATFTGANLTGADLSPLDINSSAGLGSFAGITSGGIVGTPQLPAGMQLINGYLVARSVNLAGADLHDANLSGLNLASVNFTGANLQRTDLSGANLGIANLTNANLANANLTGARLIFATVTNTNFAGATATSVVANTMTGIPANAPDGVQFRTDTTATHGAFLYPGVQLNTVASTLEGVDLSGIDLTGSNLTFVALQNTNLANTNLTNANLTSADFTGARGTPIGADTSIYSSTTCPDTTVVSAPATCIGHGF